MGVFHRVLIQAFTYNQAGSNPAAALPTVSVLHHIPSFVVQLPAWNERAF